MNDVVLPAIRCVGALIADVDGRVLLVRRANDPERGRWSVPGGRVEPGETDEAAVRREVTEETKLSVIVGRRVGTVERPAPTGTFVIHDYLCVVESGTAEAGSDAAAVRWVDAAAFAALDRAGELVDRLAETLWEWEILPRPGPTRP